MKKSIGILLVLSIATFVAAQQWAPMGARWYYSASAGGLAPTGSEYYLYEVTGDTTISGTACSKVSITYFKYQDGDTAYLPPLYTYARNDSVYYFSRYYGKFLLLYDFTAQEGDTLTFPVEPNAVTGTSDTTFRVRVESVSDYESGTAVLKKFHTTPLDQYSFWGGYMEAVGSEFLMLPQPAVLIPEWDGPLRCYVDGVHNLKFSGIECTYRRTSSIDENKVEGGLEISPNPARSSTLVTFPNPSGEECSVVLYDADGRAVRHISGINSGWIELKRENLAEGVYFIRVRKGDGIMLKGKLVFK